MFIPVSVLVLIAVLCLGEEIGALLKAALVLAVLVGVGVLVGTLYETVGLHRLVVGAVAFMGVIGAVVVYVDERKERQKPRARKRQRVTRGTLHRSAMRSFYVKPRSSF